MAAWHACIQPCLNGRASVPLSALHLHTPPPLLPPALAGHVRGHPAQARHGDPRRGVHPARLPRVCGQGHPPAAEAPRAPRGARHHVPVRRPVRAGGHPQPAGDEQDPQPVARVLLLRPCSPGGWGCGRGAGGALVWWLAGWSSSTRPWPTTHLPERAQQALLSGLCERRPVPRRAPQTSTCVNDGQPPVCQRGLLWLLRPLIH